MKKLFTGVMKRFHNKMDQLKFAIYCFERGNDARFVRYVKDAEKNNNLVYVESPGSHRKTDMIYFIDMEESHSGFFAEHNKLLSLLYFADYYGLKPVVRFHPGYCYAETHEVNGTDNPFEYYFEQPCGIGPKDLQEYQCILKSRKENGYLTKKLNDGAVGYSKSELYIEEMARITSKYIRLNRALAHQLQQEIQGLLGKADILAVHVRGTDFKRNYNGHPVHVMPEDYLKTAKDIFEKGNYEKIFIATDDLYALELFEQSFGDKLLYYKDVTRSKGNDTVMNSQSNRENHHYLLGVEVLRDMYTLAACSGMVAGLSQVSFASRIQKKSTGKDYRDLVILNHGINYHKSDNCPS